MADCRGGKGFWEMNFDDWRKMIADAYVPAPATMREALHAFRDVFPSPLSDAEMYAFEIGWLMACDALANRLVQWLDAPAGDDVEAFLTFVAEIREGYMGNNVANR